MTNNEVNIGANIPAPVIQPKAAPVAPKVSAPSKSADPKDSAAAMSKVADQRKTQTINEITEMDSEKREAKKRRHKGAQLPGCGLVDPVADAVQLAAIVAP